MAELKLFRPLTPLYIALLIPMAYSPFLLLFRLSAFGLNIEWILGTHHFKGLPIIGVLMRKYS
jgi:hypothetical protein